MLVKAVGVRKQTRAAITPLIAVVLVAVLKGESSVKEIDVAKGTVVVAVLVVKDKELAPNPHLGSQTPCHLGRSCWTIQLCCNRSKVRERQETCNI